MKCPYCNADIAKGEISNSLGGSIYWIPEQYLHKHMFRLLQLKSRIKKNGGVILSKEVTNISNPLTAYHCIQCKKVIIEY